MPPAPHMTQTTDETRRDFAPVAGPVSDVAGAASPVSDFSRTPAPDPHMTQTTDDTKRDFAPSPAWCPGIRCRRSGFSGVRLQSDTCTGLPT